MPVTNWWTVDDLAMLITGGPYLWDGTTSWTPPGGGRATSTDPTTQGYAWPSMPTETPANMAGIPGRVAALEARLAAEARGVRVWPAVGLLLLGASNTQRVTLRSPMPPGYVPSVLLTGGPLAGSFTVTAAPVDARNVDVTIKAVVAATITANALTALVFADT